MKSKTKPFLVLFIGMSLGLTAYAATLRLKTYLEISNNLEVATNVNSARPEIQSFYTNRRNQLPQKGELLEFTEQSVIVSTSLGALYCTRMINADAAKADPGARWSHHLVQFDQAPEIGLLPDAILEDVINDYAGLFWQRSPTSDEVAALKAFAKSLASDVKADATANPKILLGLCSVFSGSFSANTF